MADQKEEEESENDLLRKQGWYLGEFSTEGAKDLLQNCTENNVFIVHKTPSDQYYLSARFSKENETIEHLQIRKNESNQYQLDGQLESFTSIVDAVNSFTLARDTVLTPALGKKQQLEFQFSTASLPPAYDEANRVLGPDIAPLPKIDSITPAVPVEAKEGRISPTGSFNGIRRYSDDDSYYYGGRRNRSSTPEYMNNPHWWRYKNKCICHPKNVYHCCCHRKTYWTGYREATSGKWYDCRGTGFLRCWLLVLMWCLVWPCVGIGCCVAGCILLCIFCCCYEDDD
ncbi:PREDICTED: uncharacterized protein LOC109580472 [Amphimedon queenslandica]|uniref:SH2 domain-containing protein n=1 Tax=Amphimedon queenslandica TaxID=400682 RepID=A0A1X7VEV3_AMPQE|nr:PREDICTED: uncharacterized protein LOC109580472 [Amphimedon queenslandica]|eukprot:XP_019849237.1 PREDICTED: uncharacterized protein LOC109580472 [Amphimedon queenslandica]